MLDLARYCFRRETGDRSGGVFLWSDALGCDAGAVVWKQSWWRKCGLIAASLAGQQSVGSFRGGRLVIVGGERAASLYRVHISSRRVGLSHLDGPDLGRLRVKVRCGADEGTEAVYCSPTGAEFPLSIDGDVPGLLPGCLSLLTLGLGRRPDAFERGDRLCAESLMAPPDDALSILLLYATARYCLLRHVPDAHGVASGGSGGGGPPEPPARARH